MKSLTRWVCPSCRAELSILTPECPKCGPARATAQPPVPIPQPRPPVAPRPPAPRSHWSSAVSLPAALLGVVAFFLPWAQVSCGPIQVRFSGYDFASGHAHEKVQPQRMEEFSERFRQGLEQQREQGKSEKRRRELVGRRPVEAEPQPIVWLWVVPGACLVLALLCLFGLPRAPTAVMSAVAAACLAYFAVCWEQAASDPAVTGGGILETHWLAGYWLTWVGVAVPPLLSWLRPRRA